MRDLYTIYSKSGRSGAARGRLHNLNPPHFGPDPGGAEKTEKSVILSENWISGSPKVLNSQQFQKKMSVWLEFWATNERIA